MLQKMHGVSCNDMLTLGVLFATLHSCGGHKNNIYFRFPLVDICLPIIQIDYENFSSRSLNLGTSNVVKNP